MSPSLSKKDRMTILTGGSGNPEPAHLNFTEFVRLEKVEGEDGAVWKNSVTQQEAIFTVDPVEKCAVLHEFLTPSQPEQHAPVPPVVSLEAGLEPGMHPLAVTFFSLSEDEQKKWWHNIGVQPVVFNANGVTSWGRARRFERTSRGHLSCIFEDFQGRTAVYVMSYKTGAFFSLGKERSSSS